MKKAFTLAEVLITLGIIGVVAALTLPNLIEKHKEKVLITELKAAYSILNQAVQHAANDYGEVDTWGITGAERTQAFPTILSNYIKIAKVCPANTNGRGCTATIHYGRASNNGTYSGIANDRLSMLLANGMSVVVRYDEQCTKTVKEYNNLMQIRKENVSYACLGILVDVNGAAKPNFYSKDTFEFLVLKDGIVPSGTAGSDNGAWTFSFSNQCLNKGSYSPAWQANCTAWVLANENMDYLHCPDKIGWDSAKSCKEAE